MEIPQKDVCNKCHNTGRVKEKDGSVHVCYDCLMAGKGVFEQHGNPKDSGIKL